MGILNGTMPFHLSQRYILGIARESPDRFEGMFPKIWVGMMKINGSFALTLNDSTMILVLGALDGP